MTVPVVERMRTVLDESRNGAAGYYTQSIFTKFAYSDGVKALCEAGACFWLLDIIATECAPKLMHYYQLGRAVGATFHVAAAGNRAKLTLRMSGSDRDVWTRQIDYTDMPDIEFDLLLGVDDDGRRSRCTLILVSEW